MRSKLKALLGIVVVLGLLVVALYLPAVRPLKVKGISEGASAHQGMAEGETPEGEASSGFQAPGELDGMAIQGSALTGEEAKAQISQLHGTGIEVLDGYMAMYRSGQRQAMLWVSLSASEEDAVKLFDSMDGKMPQSRAFTDHATVTIDGAPFHFVRGQGMDNYYWRQGAMVVWIGLINFETGRQSEAVLATRDALGTGR